MVKISLKLDVRRKLDNGTYPIKIAVSRKGKTYYIPTGRNIKRESWDIIQRKVIPIRQSIIINSILEEKRLRIEHKVLELQDNGILHTLTDRQLLDYLQDVDNESKRSLFSYQAEEFINSKTNTRTKEIYKTTIKHVSRYTDYDNLLCSQINISWLKGFEYYLSKYCPSPNTRAIHLRNIRAIINYAIDNEVIDKYPFRRFKIRTQETDKRSLTKEQLQTIYKYRGTERERMYIDCFFLIFFLIGINIADLSRLKTIDNGYIIYNRKKTGTLYKIKVEPEAQQIINKYKGKKHLLRFFDRYKNYKDFAKRLNMWLKRIAHQCGIKENVTTYYARHSWATIAAQINIPNDTISECLGHKHGNKVTSIYINFDKTKIDKANRDVIDYLMLNNVID